MCQYAITISLFTDRTTRARASSRIIAIRSNSERCGVSATRVDRASSETDFRDMGRFLAPSFLRDVLFIGRQSKIRHGSHIQVPCKI